MGSGFVMGCATGIDKVAEKEPANLTGLVQTKWIAVSVVEACLHFHLTFYQVRVLLLYNVVWMGLLLMILVGLKRRTSCKRKGGIKIQTD